ncbi:outer membrane protein assembly factor BamD [Candidatus Pseudothioglobus singularis]|jgi:outer membrane protein assembly factor BamD|uniref:Outer membrane protein assembly factor BamD n=1 Tax=Candidatus Pseudothioglobus singularis PS1 TaxID=1125411 RepID=A0A0M4L442_9GAMM|nr:outer membrane protein assembly factor BamD [Candidatus Pseudothioglobus singularis]ALE01883.1 membrane protein [Candidatus Pseudothioglobus singularis PS1]
MNRRSIFSLTLIVLLSGCSFLGGDKDTRKLVADGLTPKELYEKAEDKLDGGLIEQAIDQYEIILSSYPGSKYAIQARLDIAYNLLKQKKYNRAILVLDDFIERYPSLPPTPYAYYLRGVVAEAKSSSILDKLVTDSAQRDVESVSNAYQYFVDLIEAFPNSKYSEDAKVKLVGLRNTLARHEFYIAIYYTEINAHIAAINRSKYIIENYPNSASIPDSLHLMAYNYDKINAGQLAIDVRKVLASSYPNYSPGYSVKE